MSVGVVGAHYVDAGGGGASFRDTVLALTGLQAYWRLGDASGTTITDSSGLSHGGTYGGAYTLGSTALLPSDPTATSTLFGSGSGASIVPGASWMDASTALSVGILAESTSGALMMLLNRDSGSGSRMFQFRMNGGPLEFVQIGGGVVVSASPSSYNDGSVHLFGFTFSSSTIKLYVDGVLIQTTSAAGAMGTSSENISIAKYTGGDSNPWLGNLQEAFYCTSTLAAGDWTALQAAR